MTDITKIIEIMPSLIKYVYPGLFILLMVKAKVLFNYKIELKNESLYILSISYLIVTICGGNDICVLILTTVIIIVIYSCSKILEKVMNQYFNVGLKPNLFIESVNDLDEDGYHIYVYLMLNDGTKVNGGLIGVDSNEHPEYILLNSYAIDNNGCNEEVSWQEDEPKDSRLIVKIIDCKYVELRKYK